MSELMRVSRDGRTVLVKTPDSRYARLTVGSADVSFFDSLGAARDGVDWQIPRAAQRDKLSAAVDVVDAALTELNVTELAQSERRRTYRVPRGVRAEMQRGIEWARKYDYTGPELEFARRIAQSESTDISTIRELAQLRDAQRAPAESQLGFRPGEDGYPSTERIKYALLGGNNGGPWTRKIAKAHEVATVASAFVYDPTCQYFAGGDDELSTEVDTLYVLRPDGSWAVLQENDWKPTDEPVRAQFIELDEESAAALADWINNVRDSGSQDEVGQLFELKSINPVERNLFELAIPHLDWTEIDRATKAAEMAGLAVDDGYTPEERRQNAQRQQRRSDGKFGGGAAAPAEAKRQLTSFARARLPRPLPPIDDIAARIDEYLATVRRLRGDTSEQEFAVEEPDEIIEVTPDETDVRPLYVAIVDEVDVEAVLEVVALVPPAAGQQGDVSAWKRSNGQWVAAPEILADMRGATPPPVVELSDDELVKAVLAQVDEADESSQGAPKDTAPVEMQDPVVAAGYDLYGPYGEIIPLYGDAGLIQLNGMRAAGVPGIADTPSDQAAVARLKRYWTVGEGGLKIRWNTPGDMTRCMRQLRKYLGNRAPGYCANLHKAMTGVWPGDKRNIGNND